MDRAIAVTVDSFVASQKVSCKKALARAFAKYVLFLSMDLPSFAVLVWVSSCTDTLADILLQDLGRRKRGDKIEGREGV